MAQGPGTTDQLTATEIDAALHRILASYAFSAFPELAVSLRSYVDAKIRGTSPQIDDRAGGANDIASFPYPTVLTETGRLQRALEYYYQGTGSDDPIVIEIAHGIDEAILRRRNAQAARGGALLRSSLTIEDLALPAAEPQLASSPADNRLPVVVVASGEAAAAPAAVTSLCEKLRHALVRFDEINVVYGPLRADASQYHLLSRLAPDKSASPRVALTLVDAGDGTVVWSQTYGPYPAGDLEGELETIARDVAFVLAQPLGVMHAHERGKAYGPNALYAAIVAAFDYLVGMFEDPGSYSPNVHVKVRAGLERAIELDRSFALGFAMLTWIYLREHYDMALARPGDPPALDRALKAAQRAVTLKPRSARAHEALFVALFAHGEIDAAFAEADAAMSLNPIDPFVIAAYGRRLIAVGRISPGVAMLREAAAKSAVKAAWLDFFLFLAAYLDGDLAAATRHATLDMSWLHPLGLVARALAAAGTGDRDSAQQMIDRLVTSFPNWRDDPLREIRKLIPSAEIAGRLVRDLDRLGLRATQEREVTDQSRSTERALDLIVGVTAAASAASTEADVVAACLDQICRLRRWQFGLIWYPDPAASVLTCSANSREHAPEFVAFRELSRGMSLRKGEDLPGRAWEAKAPVWSADLAEHRGLQRAKAVQCLGFKTAFACPVIFDEQVLAVFEFYSTGWHLPDRISIDAFRKLGRFLGDVFLRQRTETELRSSEQRWRSVVDNPIFGISILDARQHFLSTNKTFQAMLGYAGNELQQLTPSDIGMAGDREIEALFSELQQGKRQHHQMVKQLKRKDGMPVWVQLYVFAIRNEQSGAMHTFMMSFDITDLKRVQDGLQAARADLGRVARLNRMGAMTASIAHEVNQPLAAIVLSAKGGLRWLGRAAPDLDQVRKSLEMIVQSSHRASDIIHGVRAMFKEGSVTRTATDVNELVREVLVLAQDEIQKRLIVVETRLDDRLPTVIADRVQLQQVIFNLVTNAAEAMDAVNDRPRVLRLRSELGESGVSVMVEDSGTGIAPENRDRIFDTFFTTKSQGLGMGLAICQSIIESHGGSLSALPVSVGATFQLVLPVV